MTESELLTYLTRCNVLHGHNCTKSNLYDLRKRLIAAIATPNCETRLALAEAFGRCASSAPVPQRTIEPSCRRPSELAFSGEKLAEAGV